MDSTSLIEKMIVKLHTRSVSIFAAILMIVSGIYMCLNGIAQQGSIDIKSSFLEGKIQTGSLGLLVTFLGVVIIIAALWRVHPHEGEEINLKVSDNTIIMKNLSNRKVEEVLAVLRAVSQDKDDA